MRQNRLLRPDKPWLHLLTAAPDEAADMVAALEAPPPHRLVVRRIRGSKCRTKSALFDEVTAALQFPEYFGDNWDAFEESLNDLEWLPGDSYILLITNSHHLLDKEPADQLHTFLKILEAAGKEWGQPVTGEWARPARPFHSVLQTTHEHEPALRERLKSAGVGFDELK